MEALSSDDEIPTKQKDLRGSVDDTEETYAESVDATSGMTYDQKPIDRELECPICIKLLYRPVSTSCGHTFCQLCLEEALEHRPQCPLCRESISGAASCHENRLVQSLIAKQYPIETRRREQDIENAVTTNDTFARTRRHDQTIKFFQKNKRISSQTPLIQDGEGIPLSAREGQCQVFKDPIWTPEEVPIIFQNQKYELPFPSDYVELYFEAPMYLDMVTDVIQGVYPGFVIVLEKYKACSVEEDLANASNESIGEAVVDDAAPPSIGAEAETSRSTRDETTTGPIETDREPPTTSAPTEGFNMVGVMIEIQQCLTFNQQMRLDGTTEVSSELGSSEEARNATTSLPESQPTVATTAPPPLRARSTLHTFFTSVRSQPPGRQQSRVASWVPRRLYQHRLKIRGNRRDMWRQLPESDLFPEGCCIIRGKCLFRATVNETTVQVTRKGYSFALVTPLFDAPLSYGSGSNTAGLASHKLAESLTRSLSSKINSQLVGVCPAGRVLFHRKFGSTPPIAPRPDSVSLEAWSLWASKILQISAQEKAYLMSINNTVDRLRKINALFDGSGKHHMLALGLSSSGTEAFSWMLITGPCGSFVLGVIIFVFLVAASFWHRFGWDGRSGEWPFYSV